MTTNSDSVQICILFLYLNFFIIVSIFDHKCLLKIHRFEYDLPLQSLKTLSRKLA